MEEVTELIRSALISTKGKSDLRTLQKDFKMIVGEEIPYKHLGYNSLEQLLRNIPTLEVSKGPGGQMLVDAIATDNTKHLVGLVNRQKASRKSRRVPNRSTVRSAPRHQQQTRNIQNWQPAASGKRWGPPVQGSPRPAAVSHRQTVIRAAEPPTRASSIASRLVGPSPSAPKPVNSTNQTSKSTNKTASKHNHSNVSNNPSDHGNNKNGAQTSATSAKQKNGSNSHSAVSATTNKMDAAAAMMSTATAMSDIKFTVSNPRPRHNVPHHHHQQQQQQQQQQPQPQQQQPFLQPCIPTGDRPRMRSQNSFPPPATSPTHFDLEPDPRDWLNGSSPQRTQLPSSDSSIQSVASGSSRWPPATPQRADTSSGNPAHPLASTSAPEQAATARANTNWRRGPGEEAAAAGRFAPMEDPMRRNLGGRKYSAEVTSTSADLAQYRNPRKLSSDETSTRSTSSSNSSPGWNVPTEEAPTAIRQPLLRTPPQEDVKTGQNPAGRKLSGEDGGGGGARHPLRRNASVGDNSTVSQYLDLVHYTQTHGLPAPHMKIVPRPSKKQSSRCLYDCSIKVDGRSYQSYPQDCYTRDHAVTVAATEALADLQQRYQRHSRLLVSSVQDILARLPPIIQQHHTGIWASQVELDYEDQYEQQLPHDWLAHLDTLPNISVESTLDNKCVLKYCSVLEKNGTGRCSATSGSHVPASDISVPSNTVRLADTELTLEVTFAASTIEVWCRQLDTDDAVNYDLLQDQLTAHYAQQRAGEPAATVNPGGFYVARHEDACYRVRALHQLANHQVTCFLIDSGDELQVPRCDMFVIEREFARVPAQAFVCSLAGLEELVHLAAAAGHLDSITGRAYVARSQQDAGGAAAASTVAAIPVVLFEYQTVDHHHHQQQQQHTPPPPPPPPLNINQHLMQLITADSMVTTLEPNRVTNVYCSHADDTGDLFVQVHSEGRDKLLGLIRTYHAIDFAHEPELQQHALLGPHLVDVHRRTLYLKRWSRDGSYYRCVVNDLSPDRRYAQLYYVDYGGTEIIHLDHHQQQQQQQQRSDTSTEPPPPPPPPLQLLYPLAKICDVLCAFPYLALRVRISGHLGPYGKGFGRRACDMMPAAMPVLLKMTRTLQLTDGRQVPVCEMFQRETRTNVLFSVHDSLLRGGGGVATDAPAPAPLLDVPAQTRRTRKLDRIYATPAVHNNDDEDEDDVFIAGAATPASPIPSTGELPTPRLPERNSFLDVRVTAAVSPWNFFVQPYSTYSELQRLMARLQARYADDGGGVGDGGGGGAALVPTTLQMVQAGKIYAARHKDGHWYRTSVIKVISARSVSVFYCDFGNYANLTVEQLVPLDPEFMQLPYQAIKARLAGVRPATNAKWSVQDCEWFKERVREKPFVSVLVECQRDELYRCDVVLSLKLYDTSTPVDVEIDQLLIERGMAVSDTPAAAAVEEQQQQQQQ